MVQPNCYSVYQSQTRKVWMILSGGAVLVAILSALMSVSLAVFISLLMGVSLVLLPSITAHLVWWIGAPAYAPKQFLTRFICGAVAKLTCFSALCAIYVQWTDLRFGIVVCSMAVSFFLTWGIQALSERGGLVHD